MFIAINYIFFFVFVLFVFFFFSSRRRHTRFKCDWSSDVCSSDLVLDWALVTAVWGYVRVAIQKRFPGDADVVEPDEAVVDAGESHLLAAVFDAHALLGASLLVPEGNDEGMDAVILATHFELCEHDRDAPVAGGVADEV